jgi:hypothetical protein
MPEYRRNRIPGATYFFTVNLLDRRSDLLVTHIDALREAVRNVRRRAPFTIDAWLLCPNICTASGPFLNATLISPAAGARSRSRSRSPFPRWWTRCR